VRSTEADVLIVTALRKETEAVLRESNAEWAAEVDAASGIEYRLATLPNGLKVALTGMPQMGGIATALTTTKAIDLLSPKRVILAGIAAGIGEGVELGDVIVSDQVVDYDIGKLTSAEYQPRWRVYASDADLVRSARHFTELKQTKALFSALPKEDNGKPSHVHVGTILSASKVVANSKAVHSLRKTWTQAIGLEMEGGGGAAAAHEHPSHPTFIIIKGVCDHGDHNKNDQWQGYAATASAQLVMELLSSLGTNQDSSLLRIPPPTPPWKPVEELEGTDVSERDLLAMLTTMFNLSELKVLCFELNLSWEDLEGHNKLTDAALEIIATCRRHGKLKLLIVKIKEKRPFAFSALPGAE
jgi:nucleoside phosphorylase